MDQLTLDNTFGLARSRIPVTLDDFRQAIENRDNIEPVTRKKYLANCQKYYDFFVKKLEMNPAGKSYDIYRAYKRWLERTETIGVSTKAFYLNTARVVMQELYRMGKVNRDVTRGVKGFKVGTGHKRSGLQHGDILKIIQYVESLEDDNKNLRLKLWLAFLIFDGVRQIEITRLDVEDLRLASGQVMLQRKGAKGSKELIPIDPKTVSLLREYLTYFRPGSGALFKSMGNRRGKEDRITTMRIYQQVKEVFRQLGIKNTVHAIRHFFVTWALQNKLTYAEVMSMTGHKSMAMIQVYDDEIKKHSAKKKMNSFMDLIAGGQGGE